VGSLLALAVFAGVTFLMTGITQVMTAGRVESWRWLYLVGGALSIIAGIMAFVWPGRTLLVLAGILSWFLVFKGIVDVGGALASIRRSFWWVVLILGIVELLVGIWAAGYPGRGRPWALLPQPVWGAHRPRRAAGRRLPAGREPRLRPHSRWRHGPGPGIHVDRRHAANRDATGRSRRRPPRRGLRSGSSHRRARVQWLAPGGGIGR
jgi:Short repeat of unknown function (DUF308)